MAAVESFLVALYGFYNTVFQPLLALDPYIALGTFSATLAFLFSVIYWFLLDIEKADEIKEKISEHQEKMKKARKEDETDKASKHMQKTMSKNQQLMKLNFKPMIATMLFVALIFPWLGSTFSPVVPMEEQSNNTFTGELEYAGSSVPVTVENSSNPAVVQIESKESQVGGSIEALGMEWEIKKFGENGGTFSIHEGTVLKVSAKFVDLPFSIPFAGGALNWLGFYILIAMPLTFIFRKMLGVA